MNIVVYAVLTVLICIYLSTRYMIQQYDFYKPLENKTVIMTWTHKCIGIEDGDWGLGDIIKATYALYELSKRMQFDFIVDISQHNVSNFLVQKPHKYQNFVLENKDKIPYQNIVFDELEKYIRVELLHKDVMVIFCSGFIEPLSNTPSSNTISKDAKEFIQNIFTPKPEFKKILEQKRSMIPYQEYSILHYRLGDVYAFKCDVCVKGKHDGEEFPKVFEELNEHIKSHIKGNDILLSDSDEFRKHAKKKWGNKLFIYDHPITHVRYQNKLEETRNTLIEFLVMTKAKSIHSYTVYKWISGFVLIANKVYDVPLTWDKDDS